MGKIKGTRAERELLHMFYENDWSCCRVAGSGSSPFPAPDLLAGKKDKKFAIECKNIKGNKKYIDKEAVEELLIFSENFGVIPIIAIKFDNHGWYFLNPDKLEKSKNGNYNISIEDAQKKGLSFKELIR